MAIPRDMSEVEVAEWLTRAAHPWMTDLVAVSEAAKSIAARRQARAVRELVEAKVRHALELSDADSPTATHDQIVKYILGAP